MRVFLAAAIILAGFMSVPALSAVIEARIDISEQKMRIYRHGILTHSWKVSTGRAGIQDADRHLSSDQNVQEVLFQEIR